MDTLQTDFFKTQNKQDSEILIRNRVVSLVSYYTDINPANQLQVLLFTYIYSTCRISYCIKFYDSIYISERFLIYS